jgi:diamine N-acetyltransferase
MTGEPRPFEARTRLLERCMLTAPPSESEAQTIGAMLANMEPWATLEFSSAGIAAYLMRNDPALHRHIVRVGDTVAGILCMRSPWLRGPYIEMLGLGEAYQGLGIGKELLAWAETEARAVGSQLWVATSSFNHRAFDFYRRHGFRKIGMIEDLVRPGYDEILLRKRLD